MTVRNPDEFAAVLRERGVDTGMQRILISVLAGSDQESDLTEPVVCDGLGRIRHFTTHTSNGWPDNPLPIAPAARWLGLTEMPDEMRALVYQNAVCNWRCWYCFVPYNLLAGHASRSRWVTADQLIDLYKQLPDHGRPALIDLSGGQPDLVPEWTIWMLDALARADLTSHSYLWGDDNLSNDYLFRFLSDDQICRLADAPNYGRACCLKGFDRTSFTFNTDAPPEHFDRQLMLLRRIVNAGIDVYCYATFTTPRLPGNARDAMCDFADQLQQIDELLPLRLTPLEVQVFSPVRPRLQPQHRESLALQQVMATAWQAVLEERFNGNQRAAPITSISLNGHTRAHEHRL